MSFTSIVYKFVNYVSDVIPFIEKVKSQQNYNYAYACVVNIILFDGKETVPTFELIVSTTEQKILGCEAGQPTIFKPLKSKLMVISFGVPTIMLTVYEGCSAIQTPFNWQVASIFSIDCVSVMTK